MFKRIALSVAVASMATLSAQAQTSSTSTSASAAASAASTTTEGAISTAAPVVKKKWQAKLYVENSVGMDAANTGDFESIDNLNYVGGNYKFTDKDKLEVRQYFTGSLKEGKQESKRDDLVFQYVRSKMGKVAGSDFTGIIRLYTPTGEDHAKTGQTQLRFYGTWTQTVAKDLDMTVYISPRFYAYTKDQSGKDGLKLLNGAQFTYGKNKIVQPYVGTYLYNTYKLSGDADAATNGDNVIIDLGASFALADSVSLDFYAEQFRSLRSGTAYSLMKDTETSYILALAASM